MEENKKYYWLKLKRDFFKRHDIRIIEEMPNGKDYVLFYLKLLLESVDHEGTLRFSDAVPYNEQMLSVITNTNVDIVRSAMKVFIELKMVDVFDDQTIYMSEVEKLIGSESWSAERVRRHREKQNLLQCNTDVTSCNNRVTSCNEEIDIEIEKELELEKEDICASPAEPTKPSAPQKHKYGEYKNVLLTDEEYEKLQNEFPNDYEERIERLSSYIASKGAKYKNHLATIRNWARKDKPETNVGANGIAISSKKSAFDDIF
jgi:predicted phage replisome organizer